MNSAEKFIQDYTRNCSNEYLTDSKPDGLGGYISRRNFTPWLTPDQALRAVEIAREEVKEKAIKWVEENAAKYLVTRSVNGVKMTGLDASIGDDFKKYMGG